MNNSLRKEYAEYCDNELPKIPHERGVIERYDQWLGNMVHGLRRYLAEATAREETLHAQLADMRNAERLTNTAIRELTAERDRMREAILANFDNITAPEKRNSMKIRNYELRTYRPIDGKGAPSPIVVVEYEFESFNDRDEFLIKRLDLIFQPIKTAINEIRASVTAPEKREEKICKTCGDILCPVQGPDMTCPDWQPKEMSPSEKREVCRCDKPSGLVDGNVCMDCHRPIVDEKEPQT